MLAIIPLIVYIERGQRRIPINYAKRVVGRRMMGGQSTYLPIKVNTAGVVPIIFASAILYLPAQVAVFFPGVEWIQNLATSLSSGWVNWVLSVMFIVFFAYFYTSMVFNPEETADQLKKQEALFLVFVQVLLLQRISRLLLTESPSPVLSLWQFLQSFQPLFSGSQAIR